MMLSTTSTTQTIDAYFDDVHRDYERQLADIEFLEDRRSFQSAARRFAELQRQIETHISTEVSVLLPLFVEHTGDPYDVVRRIQFEHATLCKLLQELSAAISQWDRARATRLVHDIGFSLKAHRRTEALMLHPALDALVRNDHDLQAMVERATHTILRPSAPSR